MLDNKLKEDKNIALIAVKKDGLNLEFVSDKFKNDLEVVIEAIKNNGKSLQYASETMQNNREIVLASINSTKYGTSNSLKDINEKFRDDKEIVIEAIRHTNGFGYELISDRLKNDKDVTYNYASQEGFDITKIADKFKEDKEIIMRGIGSSWRESDYILKNASPKFRDDKDVMLIAVKNYPLSLELASERLKNDIEVVRTAVEYNTYVMKDEDDNEKIYQDDYVFNKFVGDKIKEKYSTIEKLLNSEKEVLKNKTNNLEKKSINNQKIKERKTRSRIRSKEKER